MGASQSIMTPENFSDKIFSIVLISILPQIDKKLVFSDDPENPHSLPYVSKKNLYEYYEDFNRRRKIDEYLERYILNDGENISQFISLLTQKLKKEIKPGKLVPAKTQAIPAPAKTQAMSAPPKKQATSAPVNVQAMPAPPLPLTETKADDPQRSAADQRLAKKKAKLEQRILNMVQAIDDESSRYSL
jgi:hypothetical protein